MRVVGRTSSACELAREHISVHLDGELSEYEQVALDAHLTNCGGCRAYGAAVAEPTTRLRSAPLEQPDFPVVLSHRSRIRVALRTAQVAAAAVVVAVVGFSAFGVTTGSKRSPLLGDDSAGLANRDANPSADGAAPRPIRAGAEIV